MRRSLPCLFILFVAFPAPAAQTEWTGVERVVAVGDVHGDYGAFVEVLGFAGIIDAQNHWTGGKTHLVQVGDIPDRGPDSRKAMDLLMNLEKEAARAGGHVHALIGNHEVMNMMGDLRYTTPGEFASFSDADSAHVRESYWKRLPGSRAATDSTRQKWEADHPLGWLEHRLAYGPQGKYGKWIRAHNAVVLINDTIFLHGGISARYASVPLKSINEMVAADLENLGGIKPSQSPLTAEDGPLWYRGLSQEWYTGEGLEEGSGIPALVDQVLAFNHAKRIVIGHTSTGGGIIPLFGGKVIMIDVGLTATIAAGRAVLLLEGDAAYAIHRSHKIPLPADTAGTDFIAYLKKLMTLEPPQSKFAGYLVLAEAAQGKGH